MHKATISWAALGPLFCLPCLLAIAAAAGGAGAAIALVGWLSDNLNVTLSAGVAALLFAAFGLLIYRRRAHTACSPDGGKRVDVAP